MLPYWTSLDGWGSTYSEKWGSTFNRARIHVKFFQVNCLTVSACSSLTLTRNSFWCFCRLFRKYGAWVARNPTLVLCSSLAVVLLLCLGLFRFKVETRPEKVWFGICISIYWEPVAQSRRQKLPMIVLRSCSTALIVGAWIAWWFKPSGSLACLH